MRTTLQTLATAALFALTLTHCGAPDGDGFDPEDDNTRTALRATSAAYPLCRWWGGRMTTLTQDQMNRLYYDVHASPESEKAYQPGDPEPPIALRPTYADSQGRITVLQTSLYNRSGAAGVSYGTTAHFVVHSPRGTRLCEDWGTIPFRLDIPNLTANGAYYIQPMTLNTQAKILPTSRAW